MTNKNCIIVHGCPSDKEKAMDRKTRTYDKHWMPWLTKQLNKRGIETYLPLMPHPWKPSYEDHKKVFKYYTVNQKSILIGHSCGCTFLVRWLGENKINIDKLILVAPWKVSPGDNDSKLEFYKMTIDPTIKERINQIYIFTSDNEADEGKEGLKMYHKSLDGTVINLKSHGHYCYKDMLTEEFPELLNIVLND